MNKQYQKFRKKYNYKNRQYNNYKKGYYHKKYQYDNSYGAPYENIIEEEISYDTKTMETSFSQSSKSTSRKQSISDNNDNISCENNKEPSFIIIENNITNNSSQNFTKINLSESELETAFYKPKNYKSDFTKKPESKFIGENIVILDINIKICDNKSINFKLRKFDDMVQLVKEACTKNELDDNYANFFVYTIIKALNSIYGIYNLPLKKEEIEFLQNLNNK